MTSQNTFKIGLLMDTVLAAHAHECQKRLKTGLISFFGDKWAFNEKIIPSNPVIGLTKFYITNKERGILTETEAAAVFATDWKDKRAFVASLIAATTGARQCNSSKNLIKICTKNEKRTIPNLH